ncbi:hypothetical protein H2200_001931 [Cladophialophora chaetospira]|uniref:Uncharacterized protein n=1 Tax=Cladophialophora chaetospira TaxID=386627 RepID=A0AA38XLT2_9EURO|nr:hypothetical protein H2200_001931 [Cladophialophora chaetospira]
MDLNYGYLCSTKEVAKDFSNYDTFLRDKATFESVPNIIISRSLDSNSEPLDPPQAVLGDNYEPPDENEDNQAYDQQSDGGVRL